MYRQALEAVNALDKQHHRAPDEHSVNLAAALMAAARCDGLTRIDHMGLSDGARLTYIVQGELNSPFKRMADVSITQATTTPISHGGKAWQQATRPRTHGAKSGLCTAPDALAAHACRDIAPIRRSNVAKETSNMSTTTTRRRGPGGPINRNAFLLFLALTPSACGSPMKTPDIKQNPNPKQRYEITLRIDNAPGPFDSVTGSLDYQVSNGGCVPLTPVSGATIVPHEHIPFTLTRVENDVYKGTLYTDQLLDEDYYGLGVCQWEFVAVGIELKFGKVNFSPSLFVRDMKAGKPVTTYFSKNMYARAGEIGDAPLTDAGRLTREEYKDSANTFSATLTAQEHIQ